MKNIRNFMIINTVLFSAIIVLLVLGDNISYPLVPQANTDTPLAQTMTSTYHPPSVTPNLGGQATQTATATRQAPTYTPTLTPEFTNDWLASLLNEQALIDDEMTLKNLKQLGDFLGTTFTILDVRFPLSKNGIPETIQIHAGCECPDDDPCCTPEQIFILTMEKLAAQRDNFIEGVPPTAQKMEVICYDRVTPIGVISVDWEDVVSFLFGGLNGYQLGLRIQQQ